MSLFEANNCTSKLQQSTIMTGNNSGNMFSRITNNWPNNNNSFNSRLHTPQKHQQQQETNTFQPSLLPNPLIGSRAELDNLINQTGTYAINFKSIQTKISPTESATFKTLGIFQELPNSIEEYRMKDYQLKKIGHRFDLANVKINIGESGIGNNNNNNKGIGEMFAENQNKKSFTKCNTLMNTGINGNVSNSFFGRNTNLQAPAQPLVGGLFNNNNNNAMQPQQVGGLFNNNAMQQQQQVGGLFSNYNNNNTGGIFSCNRQQQQQPQSGLFSTNITNASTANTLFSNMGNNNQQQGGLFSSIANTNQPQQQQGGLFSSIANTNQPQQQQGGLFSNIGNTNQPQQQQGGLFSNIGNTNQPQQQQGGLFSNIGNTTQGGLFTNPTTNTNQTSGGLFSNLNSNSAGGLFSNNTANTTNASQSTGGGLFSNAISNTAGGLFSNQSITGGLFANNTSIQPQQLQPNSLFSSNTTSPFFSDPNKTTSTLNLQGNNAKPSSSLFSTDQSKPSTGLFSNINTTNSNSNSLFPNVTNTSTSTTLFNLAPAQASSSFITPNQAIAPNQSQSLNQNTQQLTPKSNIIDIINDQKIIQDFIKELEEKKINDSNHHLLKSYGTIYGNEDIYSNDVYDSTDSLMNQFRTVYSNSSNRKYSKEKLIKNRHYYYDDMNNISQIHLKQQINSSFFIKKKTSHCDNNDNRKDIIPLKSSTSKLMRTIAKRPKMLKLIEDQVLFTENILEIEERYKADFKIRQKYHSENEHNKSNNNDDDDNYNSKRKYHDQENSILAKSLLLSEINQSPFSNSINPSLHSKHNNHQSKLSYQQNNPTPKTNTLIRSIPVKCKIENKTHTLSFDINLKNEVRILKAAIIDRLIKMPQYNNQLSISSLMLMIPNQILGDEKKLLSYDFTDSTIIEADAVYTLKKKEKILSSAIPRNNNKKTTHSTERVAPEDLLPVLTRSDLNISPDYLFLCRMTIDELKEVENVKLYNEHGMIEFEDVVNLLGMNLDNIVNITPFHVDIYNNGKELPEIGTGLNVKRKYTVKNMFVENEEELKDIKKYIKEREGVFITYNDLSGDLVFKQG